MVKDFTYTVPGYPPFRDRTDLPCIGRWDLFTPTLGRRPRTMQAKMLCRTCDVLMECRTWAIIHHETGVWGATTEYERAMFRRKKVA